LGGLIFLAAEFSPLHCCVSFAISTTLGGGVTLSRSLPLNAPSLKFVSNHPEIRRSPRRCRFLYARMIIKTATANIISTTTVITVTATIGGTDSAGELLSSALLDMAFLLFLLLLDYSLQCPKTVPLLKISRDEVVVVLVFVVGAVGFHAFVVVELEFRELVLIVVYQLLLLILLMSSAKLVSPGSCSTIVLA
jgi:hypothetical protein